MDNFTKWDVDIQGPGTYTGWDDVAGGPNETQWDLLPEVIGRGFRVIWGGVTRVAAWASPGRRVRW